MPYGEWGGTYELPSLRHLLCRNDAINNGVSQFASSDTKDADAGQDQPTGRIGFRLAASDEPKQSGRDTNDGNALAKAEQYPKSAIP